MRFINKELQVKRSLIVFFISLGGFGLTQSFESPVANDFNLNPIGYTSAFHFVSSGDLDGDGDVDLLISDFDSKFHYYENIGSTIAPNFSSGVVNPFGINVPEFGVCSCNHMPQVLVDIDGDGDLDLFAANWYQAAYLFAENIGTAQAPSYSDFTESFSWKPGTFNYPSNPGIAFVDIDNDGDLDFFSGQQSAMRFFENTGTAQAPTFTSAMVTNPFGLAITGDYIFPSFSDIDNDGDFDLFIGNQISSGDDVKYFENTGTSASASFQSPVLNPFNIENSSALISACTFSDYDNDGDSDLIISGKIGPNKEILFLENLSIVTSITELEENTFQISPNPATTFFQVHSADDISVTEYSILDVSGRLVQYEKISQKQTNKLTIQIDLVLAGSYFLKLTTLEGTIMKKLIIE